MIPLTALYVPGDRPDRFDKAVASGADIVVVDLEDAVHPARKAQALRNVTAWMSGPVPVPVQIRINASGTPWQSNDLLALSQLPAVQVVRIPKASTTDDVDRVMASLRPAVTAICLIENAAGLQHASRLGRHPQVSGLGLGEADLSGDLGVEGDDGLAYARGTVVCACRAGGLASPMASAFVNVMDDAGLIESTRKLSRLGFLGRMAIHPRQIRPIRDAFRPTPERLRSALDLLEIASAAGVEAGGVTTARNGQLVDAAMVAAAVRTVSIAQSCGST